MSYRVKNWEKYQHYHSRTQPLNWVKLHNSILTSEDWVCLDDSNRVLMVVCLLIAARSNGEIPDNPEYIQRLGFLNGPVSFGPLLKCGFLIHSSTSLAMSSMSLASARIEERRVEERREEKSTLDSDEPNGLHSEENDPELPLEPEFTPKKRSTSPATRKTTRSRVKDTPKPETDVVGACTRSAWFESFWSAVPAQGRNRSSKKLAGAEFNKIAKTREDAEQIMASLKAFCLTQDWAKENGKYVPGIHRWLKDGKWQDIPEQNIKPGEAAGNFEWEDLPNG